MSKLKMTLLIALVVLLSLFISSQTMAAVCTVPGTYSTIQDAIDDVGCDPINVGAGTYNENIVINRALTLMGAGSASTFINGVNTGPNVAAVNITSAGNVTLSGFTITNAPTTNDSDLRFGILTNSPSPGVIYTIVNNKVVGTNDPDAYEDYGIYGQSGGKENLVITNNVVTQTGSNNIVVETHQGTTDISYNTLDAGCWGTDAIFVMTLSGVNVTSLQKVSHNTIDLSTGGPFDYDHRATGITFATGVTTGVGGQFTNVQITNNKVINLKSNRRGIGFWNNAGGDGSAGNIIAPLVSNNTVSGAPGDVTASRGIDTIGLVTNAVITNNTVTGVDFSFREAIWKGHIATGTQLNFNSFTNNSSGVLTFRTTGTLNAEYNWWGDASGPGPVGPGTGDNVSLNVDYDPWLQIYWKDYNGEALGGYMPDIDQNQDFDKVIVRTEQDGTGVSYTGTWTTYPTPPDTTKASGGTLRYSNDLVPPEASCSFTFNGTSISWIGFKQNNMGISEVWIDGNLMGTIDLYAPPPTLWKQVLYTNNNLSHGQHTITIKPTNQKNALSTGLYTDVDAFDVDNKEQHYCAPVAEANSLWWLDKKWGLGLFEPPDYVEYLGDDVNGDGVYDILDLVQELAIRMNTNVGHTGTLVGDEVTGIASFLEDHALLTELYVHREDQPEFLYIEEEVERSQDVKLDLGFWNILACNGVPGNGSILWQRVGGHAVTVAGVDSQNFLLAVSDPDNDAAENGGLGVIRPVPGGHPLHPNDTSIHNIEANASHDIYTVVPSASPGGIWALKNYPGKVNFPTQEWGQPTPTPWPLHFYPCEESLIITEIETAVLVSPIICGNGHVDPGETCDPPGGQLPPSGNPCDADCTFCGDVNVDADEACDDGNANNNDACLNNCMLASCGDGIIGPGETCDPPGQPGPGPQPGTCRQTCTYCGDGIPNNGEQCDDGNGNNNDICENDCTPISITCSFTPGGTPPIQIMRGGILRFRVDIYNNENTTQSFKFATKVKLPSGNMYPHFLIGPVPVTVNANSSKGGNTQMSIPSGAPLGTYTYYGYVGNTPPPVQYGSCQFNFTVVQ